MADSTKFKVLRFLGNPRTKSILGQLNIVLVDYVENTLGDRVPLNSSTNSLRSAGFVTFLIKNPFHICT